MKDYTNSTLMAMKKTELVGIIRCLEHNVEAVQEMNDRQFKLLCQRDFYRWHNLRKDPADLPMSMNVYLVRTITTYMTAMYETFERKWIIDEGYTVIAWKEIEPFESEDV